MARKRVSPTTTPRARPTPKALVASGQQVDVTDRQQLAAFRRRAQKSWWQERAALLDDEVPLLGFAHDYVRDSMAKVVPIPAIIDDDPSKPALPLDDDNTPTGLDPELCRQILDRLNPFPDFMGSLARKLDVVGEAHVALIPDTSEIDGERCEVFSPDELTTRGDGYFYREDPTDTQGTLLDPSAFVFRVWQADSRWRMLPTSHMRRLIGIADTLLLLTQVIRGISKSRLAMGGRILGIADEFSLESATQDGHAPTEDAGDGEGRTDTFMDDFFTAADESIHDPEGPSAIIPLILRGPLAFLKDGIVDIALDRPYDETLIKLRQELREEIANGVNLPRELLLGIGSTNHWNAEEIKNQTWQTHLEPRAMGICAAITTGFYRAQLIANNVPPDIVRRCVVGYDPSWFIGAPDLADQADAAYDRYEISGDYYRQVKRIPETARPDLDEIKDRLWIKQQERVTTRVMGDATDAEIEGTPTGSPNEPLDDTTATTDAVTPAPQADDSAPTAPTAKKAQAIVASAGPTALDRLGARLVGIERDLRTRLHADACNVVSAALEKAGMRVRGKTRNRAAIAAQIETTPYREIPARIGPAGVIALGLTDHTLIEGALGTLEASYHRQVRRAQHGAATAAASASGREFDTSDLDRRMADNRDQGWAVLSAGILTLVTALLYDPHPAAPEHGEFDDSTVVPLGLIRAALDRAGGAQVGAPRGSQQIPATLEPRAAGAAPPGGGATAGPTMLDEFKQQLGIVDDHYEWVYGDAPRREFPPHLALDGVTFTAWDDPVLANDDSFPDAPFLSPQDHDGCACDYSVTFAQADQ